MFKMLKNQFNVLPLHHQNESQVGDLILFNFRFSVRCFFSSVEIRYDPKENSFQNAFLKFLAGEKLPSLETLANEPIMRKPKDNIYIGAVNAGIVLSSLNQPTGSMGYQTYMVNNESHIEEIMLIPRPLYDDNKGVKINPLLKTLPTVTTTNQTSNYLPQTITLTPNSGLFRNTQTVPNLLNTAVRFYFQSIHIYILNLLDNDNSTSTYYRSIRRRNIDCYTINKRKRRYRTSNSISSCYT